LFLKWKESLAWRINTTIIKPLFFREFLDFKNKIYLLEKPLLFENDLILEFEKYLYRQFYDIIDSNIIEAKKYTNSLKNKIIKEDCKNYFEVKYPDLLLKLFDIFANNPWMVVDYNNLWNDLWIDSRTVQTYIYYLEESFLLNKVYNFSKNLLTSEKKQKKIYLNSTSFFSGNWDITWELFENYIQNYFDFKYFYRFNKKEVDFIGVDDDWKINAYEVKYKQELSKNDFSWLWYFSKNFEVKNSFIITKSIEKEIDSIKIIPFWKLGEIIKS
jgi:predicted AAA+ superfamily ATPase